MSPTANEIPPDLAACPTYQDVRELGRGGMGVVYLARNRLMDRLEVLKLINRSLVESEHARERFLREIRAAGQLLHPHVVVAYSAQELGPLLVFAMEYVPGENLHTLVTRSGPLSVRRACTFACQTALGLQHAFERGMVHRDIKPGNIICTTQFQKTVVKIVDFGLAKLSREVAADGNLTVVGSALGTPLYMAPEQARDATQADTRADVYSLGATLYYLLTGRPPIEGKTYNDIVIRLYTDPPTPIRELRADVPAELAVVIGKMLAKKPEDRYATPADAARALQPFCKTKAGTDAGPEPASAPNLPVAVLVEPSLPPAHVQVPTIDQKQEPATPPASTPVRPVAMPVSPKAPTRDDRHDSPPVARKDRSREHDPEDRPSSRRRSRRTTEDDADRPVRPGRVIAIVVGSVLSVMLLCCAGCFIRDVANRVRDQQAAAGAPARPVNVPAGWERFNDPLGEIELYFPASQPQQVEAQVTPGANTGPVETWRAIVGDKSYTIVRATASDAEMKGTPEKLFSDVVLGMRQTMPGSPEPITFDVTTGGKPSRVVILDNLKDGKRIIGRVMLSGNRMALALVVGGPLIQRTDADVAPFLDNMRFLK